MIFINWETFPKIREMTAVRKVSPVGGQGMTKCNCKGNIVHAKKLEEVAAQSVIMTTINVSIMRE